MPQPSSKKAHPKRIDPHVSSWQDPPCLPRQYCWMPDQMPVGIYQRGQPRRGRRVQRSIPAPRPPRRPFGWVEKTYRESRPCHGVGVSLLRRRFVQICDWAVVAMYFPCSLLLLQRRRWLWHRHFFLIGTLRRRTNCRVVGDECRRGRGQRFQGGRDWRWRIRVVGLLLIPPSDTPKKPNPRTSNDTMPRNCTTSIVFVPSPSHLQHCSHWRQL
mmetsp:Transcript_34543/g.72860  ORF Transcript_34543/g.72860 Transcript_34543/m.72860 type:complete len:214 (+) Transcript_34543:2197-2838(+)